MLKSQVYKLTALPEKIVQSMKVSLGRNLYAYDKGYFPF